MPPRTVASLVEEILSGARHPALVVTESPLELSGPPAQVSVALLADGVPTTDVRTLVLVVADVASLRRAASALGGERSLGRARTIAVVVEHADAALTLQPHPMRPPLADLDARLVGGPTGTTAVTTVVLQRRAPAGPVLAALARAAALPVTAGHAGLRVAASPSSAAGYADRLPPADPSLVDPAGLDLATEERPPDVVLGVGRGAGPDGPDGPGSGISEVTGRAPVVVHDADDLHVGPLDEALFHPVGFPRTSTGAVLDLDPAAVLTPALAATLRAAEAVRVTWPCDERTLAGLAMSGVVLHGTGPVPPRSRARLGDRLADLLDARPQPGPQPDAQPELGERSMDREEQSVRLRRAALTEHSSLAWRGRLAARAGVRHAAYPSVSVLLPTRRPEQLDHALRQVARQRSTLPGAEVELVLAAHGFTPDPARVAAALGGPGGLPHTVLTLPPELGLGEVLRAATDAASGDVVLKMDDDDWYGPDVVTDLLLARRYTGAELVGMPAELVHLEPIGTTVRRRGSSEQHGSLVAGGTMLIDRSLLRGLGGWRPVRHFVDAQLLDAVRAAGGSVYRTHGLGYVLRRTAAGHTWDRGLGYFLTRRAVATQWRGFRPSALLEDDPA